MGILFSSFLHSACLLWLYAFDWLFTPLSYIVTACRSVLVGQCYCCANERDGRITMLNNCSMYMVDMCQHPLHRNCWNVRRCTGYRPLIAITATECAVCEWMRTIDGRIRSVYLRVSLCDVYQFSATPTLDLSTRSNQYERCSRCTRCICACQTVKSNEFSSTAEFFELFLPFLLFLFCSSSFCDVFFPLSMVEAPCRHIWISIAKNNVAETVSSYYLSRYDRRWFCRYSECLLSDLCSSSC